MIIAPAHLTHRHYQIVITSGLISTGIIQMFMPDLQNMNMILGVIINLIWLWEKTESEKGKI